jgi:hypothetical protein
MPRVIYPYLRPRLAGLALAAWSLATPAGAAPEALGTLSPRVEAPEGTRCQLEALRTERPHRLVSVDASPVQGPPGLYRLRLDCEGPDGKLSPPLAPVRLAAGATATLRVKLERARFRVMASRNGARSLAEVALFAPAPERLERPLAVGAANAKFEVAAGRYDVRVRLEGKGEGLPSVWLRGVSLGPSGVTERTVDLSDGRLQVDIRHNKRPAGARIRVLAADGETELARLDAGEAAALPPGEVVVLATLLDAEARTEVSVPAGKLVKTRLDFTTGQLELSARGDDGPLDAIAHLARPGAADDFNFFPVPASVALSPGTYEVKLAPRTEGAFPEQRRTVEVSAGRKSRLALVVARASLRVRLVGDIGDAPVVRVRAAGGGAELGDPDVSGRYRAWPGRYEVLVTLADGTELLDGPFELGLGEKLERTIEVKRGALVADAFRGTASADAEVFVYRPGAKAPVAKGRAHARLELSPGVYDVKVVSGPEWRWFEGVKLRAGKETRLEARFRPNPGTAPPSGELAPLDDELPAGE